ncbi:linear amide C-N hydrolase [Streptomyces sp. MRC013]|uniref:linear amide C-N hydrolase n=1 Tax=Streptomyces sp. MRC013 TaxID=2898276 RepID=UPI00202752C7|nr:linear amide C-N hydrolase [Streptomyces sp. MRC013]URM92176.1 linear amide C-N hydrolase [Streptomyces sp. MRC013]
MAIAYDSATTDGINEAGLGAHLPWLAEPDYGERDPRLPAVSAALWTQYLLDRFPTVAEAVDALEAELFQVRPQGDAHAGTWSTVHLALDHATGDSAVVECRHARDVTGRYEPREPFTFALAGA